MLPPFRAVLFDCDGVLADTEAMANRIVASELTALGWPLGLEEAQREFLGLSLPDMLPRIAARVGPLPEGWAAAVATRITAELSRGIQPMPGAMQAVAALAARGVPLAVCSNSGREELAVKMRVLGLLPFFGTRVFSFEDVPRPKPAPDLYVTAASACGVPAAECLVVEDSATGVAAGLAAGCRVVALLPGLGVPVVGLDAFHGGTISPA